MTLLFWLANALVSLIEQLAALAFFLFGRNQHRASEQPYKGTRPPQPRAIALVWAEAAVDEGAAKQISDILKWCAQEELRDFIVYDPSGGLKAHAEELRRALQCSVEVGWSRDPAAVNLLCGACGEQAEGRETAQLEEVPTTTRLGSGKTQGLLAEALGTAGAPDVGQQLLPGADTNGGGRARQAERGVNAAVSMEDLDVPSFGPAAPLRCSEELCTCGGLRGPSAPRSVAVTDRDATVREAGAPSNSCSQSVQAVRQSRRVGASASGRMVDSTGAGAARPLLAVSAAGDDAVLAAAAAAVTLGSSPAAFGPSAGAQQERHASESHLGHQGQASHFANGCAGANGLRRSDALEPRVGNMTQVRVLSAADAYSPVLEAARSGGRCAGCGEVLPLQGGPYREGLARMRGQLQQLAGNEVLIQPELVLVVGPALTLAGYPPFQVATSEILHIGPAAQLCRSKVDGALAKYLRTEQRFGS